MTLGDRHPGSFFDWGGSMGYFSGNVSITHLGHDASQDLAPLGPFDVETGERARSFHRTLPGYAPTPLVSLEHMAAALGVRSIWVKDESKRFDLGAFKVLGGSFAVSQLLAERLGLDPERVTFQNLIVPSVRERVAGLTLITTTDGNHGRGVAWTANRLGMRAVVYMPKGTAPERLENIRRLGAEASITDMGYDDAVRYTARLAEENGWILVQDTSWPGYEKVPRLIMQGYTTLGAEICDQLGDAVPTHLFLQAGVGSMAGALAAYFANRFGAERPRVIVVEPDGANCLFRTASANDGRLHGCERELHSIMAGLCCGEVSGVAWDILKDYADDFVSMPDEVAAQGMRVLGAPMLGDERVISGESGASTFGFVEEVLRREDGATICERLGLNEDSRILCISTEGATDRANYRRIVWDGSYPVS